MKINTVLDSQTGDDSWQLEITVDREKLIEYFCNGRHLAAAFRKAQRDGSTKGTRCRGGIRFKIKYIEG